MNGPLDQALKRRQLEQFASLLAERRRRAERKLHATRGHRDENGVWVGGLLAFTKYFWHIIEPGRKMVEGWPLEAIAEHLEGAYYGEYNRLLITVPPGCMKSLLSDVFFPAWIWAIGDPGKRFIGFSYSSSLTERDNGRFRDLIMHPDFQIMYGDVFKVRKQGETKVSNNKTGWKLASSVGGVGTGERGDVVLCLPYNERILTDAGYLKIGDIVSRRLPVKVLGSDENGNCGWQEIEEYETNPTGIIFEIQFDGGSLRCTADHPIFIEGRGYVRADSVQEGWTGRIFNLPAMPESDLAQTEPSSEVLFEGMPFYVREGGRAAQRKQAVCDMRPANLSAAGSLGAVEGSPILQPQMPWTEQYGGEQPELQNRSGREELRTLWRGILGEIRRCKAAKVLLRWMRSAASLECKWKAHSETFLCSLRNDIQASKQSHNSLQPIVRVANSIRANKGGWKRSVRSWRGSEGISARVEQEPQESHSRSRRESMSFVQPTTREENGFACSPYQLRERGYQPRESDYSVQVLPWKDARQEVTAGSVDSAVIRSVKFVGIEPVTYNVRVGPHHNYFAQGLLVHNCDDLHNVKDGESETVRTETVRWFREALPDRLNDLDTGIIIVIMQRVHENDVAGTILAEEFDYCHLLIRMQFVWDADDNGEPFPTELGWVDPRWTEDPEECTGQLMWPERFSPEAIERLEKEKGPYAWAAQYQQTPEPRGGGILKREYWQPWPEGKKFPPFEYVFASLDGAFTEDESNDPSGLTIWGVWRDGDYPRAMLVFAWKKFLKFEGIKLVPEPGENQHEFMGRQMAEWGLVEWTAHTMDYWRCDRLLIEAKANGMPVAESLVARYRNKNWSVQLEQVKHDKVARAIAVQASFSQGLIYAPVYGSKKWCDTVQDDCAVFPKGTHDDLVDSTTQAIKHLRVTGLLEYDEDVRAKMMAEARLEASQDKNRDKIRNYLPGTS